VRWWTSGRRSTYDPMWARAVLEAIEAGAPLSHVLGTEGMPSSKAWYRWLKTVPGLAARYAEACRWRAIWLGAERDLAIDRVWVTGIPAANAALRRIEGREGRLRPKLYRTKPTS
jgi:hypothetical protein